MTFRMIVQLWNTNTSAFVSCDADLTENYMYISMKFGTGVHVFCWEVGVFNRSSFQSVSYNALIDGDIGIIFFLADLKNEPYRRADAIRRSQKRRTENMVHAPLTDGFDTHF